MAKSLCRLLISVNHAVVAIFYVANMSFVDLLCFFLFCLVFAMSLCAFVYICALRSPAGKRLTGSWLSFVMSNCEFVTFPLISWVRCGT